MSAQIHTALMNLGQALEGLDRAVKLRERERLRSAGSSAADRPDDLFAAADKAGQVLDTARLSRTLDRAIASVEAILKEG